MEPIEPIGRGQFFLLTAVSVVAGGVYIWPQTVISDSGRDAAWAIAISIATAMILVWLQTLWPPKTVGATELGRMHSLWGIFRWPVFMATALLYVLLDGALLALFSQLLSIAFYPRTPRLVFTLSITVLCIWFASKSLTHLARTVQFWFPLVIGSFLLLTLLSLGNLRNPMAILPSSQIQLLPIGRGFVATWYLWIQGELIVTAGGHVRGTSWSVIRRWALAAILFQGFIIILIYVLVIGTLGPNAADTLEWPLIYIFSNLTVQTIFISRPGLLIMIAWVIALILYLAVHLWVLSSNLQEGWHLRKRYRIILIAVIAGLWLLIAHFLPTPIVATHLVVRGIDPVALTVTVFTTVSAVVLSLWHHHRQRL
ncbi:Spore germination protein [Sulfobacillus thermosulfidooxidans DSM 9293]|uniref:Spore germination protein n=1 Tax=Sulfobacillus thermosulfidooxidans (strain DSM 9293 / VKM B-1269 / AT-1) TaxID=929705 RepID=A0A1W1W7C6_SULTA|nr:GerAB/ArcD/ProY family transporter [Sulfobacillus thermosulfidooxidans]SMC02178.1 Spore germination protein [Sulfobacillus thermosulfidooxidans DSM 9293]